MLRSRGRREFMGVLTFLVLLFSCRALFALEENKVIIRKFDWRIYATEHFDIYYYSDSKPWLPYVSDVLEKAYKREAEDLNPALNKRIPFFLFASINDMQQSNVADVSDGVGGLTEPYKDRFMVWSDGSRGWLKNVIEHEFAHEVEFSVLIDGFWKSARILKTFIYPLWMMEGMAEYETGGADLALERMYLRDAAVDGKVISLTRLNQFAHLKPHQITLAYKTGAEAVRFLAEQYGKDKPARMLELFKTKYEASSVLLPLIGTDIVSFDKKFREYLELKYLSEVSSERLAEPGRYGRKLTAEKDDIPEFNMSPQLSPDGKKLAFISTRKGHPSIICVRDLATGKDTTITSAEIGAENIPYGRFSKPLRSLSFSGDGRYLAFSGQKNHREYIYIYSLSDRKISRLYFPDLAEARQPAFSADSSRIIFVGMKDSFNDLYELAITSRTLEGGSVPYSALKRLTDGPEDESSPAYSPDGSGFVYSCEIDTSSGPKRALCYGGSRAPLAVVDGSIYDPSFSPDGSRLVFNADIGDNFELYQLELASGRISRLTRTIGGNFTPAYSPDGKGVIFSSFRNGSMNVYNGGLENFLYEDAGRAAKVLPAPAPEAAVSSGTYRSYKFRASTDLFFPAFMFSSPGGLFWMNYWQASDMLGHNNLSLFLNYNSGSDFLSYQLNYSYAKFRMPIILQTAGFTSKNNLNDLDLEYNKRYARNVIGTAYPFDRYNRIEAFFLHKNESFDYTQLGVSDRTHTRALQASFVRDTVNGLYLTAVEGARTELTHIKAVEEMGGDQRYDVDMVQRLQYFPLSKRSALVDRFVAGRSVGRDKKYFDFGGLGGVRGFSSTSDLYSDTKVLINNFELRTPLFKDMNYYMWFMFPDFYFKAIYAKVFFDSAYGWERSSQLRNFSASDIRSAAGVGVNIHTFILQAFQLVLSFDYAVRTHDGGKIFYFYLGPLF